MSSLRITPLSGDVTASVFAELLAESEREGFRMIRRLTNEYKSGAIRFDGMGEFLRGAYRGNHLVGVGGVTRDPYVTETAGISEKVGRIRHVYVLPDERRKGIGRILVSALIEETRQQQHFSLLTLRTDSASAAAFYETLGFTKSDDRSPNATQYMHVRQ